MPCNKAMLMREVITATPNTTIEEVIDLFDANSIRSVPVIDDAGVLVGLFNFHQLLMSILPLPADLGEGATRQSKKMKISLDYLTGQSDWLAGRLKGSLDRPLCEVMVSDPKFVHPETPLREGVRLLAQYCSPLPVVEEGTNKLVGLISSQSALQVLMDMKVDLKRGKPVDDFEE